MTKRIILLATLMFATVPMLVQSCAVRQDVYLKSGAQIWGENCIRCHNAASPGTFTDDEWDVISMHMQDRANLTEEEIEKVIEFLKSSN